MAVGANISKVEGPIRRTVNVLGNYFAAMVRIYSGRTDGGIGEVPSSNHKSRTPGIDTKKINPIRRKLNFIYPYQPDHDPPSRVGCV